MGRVGVAIDVVARAAVIVVCVLLIREFWGVYIGPNGDGVPVRLAIPPLAAYVVWNVWVAVRSIRALRRAAGLDTSFLANVGGLSVVRLVWLLPLADDLWWRHRDRLMVLVVASVTAAALTFGAAIRSAASERRLAPRPDRARPRRAS
jgi:hypothetical protein